jgi:hypothetical protein
MEITKKDGAVILLPVTATDYHFIDVICLGLLAYENKANDSLGHLKCYPELNQADQDGD